MGAAAEGREASMFKEVGVAVRPTDGAADGSVESVLRREVELVVRPTGAATDGSVDSALRREVEVVVRPTGATTDGVEDSTLRGEVGMVVRPTGAAADGSEGLTPRRVVGVAKGVTLAEPSMIWSCSWHMSVTYIQRSRKRRAPFSSSCLCLGFQLLLSSQIDPCQTLVNPRCLDPSVSNECRASDLLRDRGSRRKLRNRCQIVHHPNFDGHLRKAGADQLV